MRTYAFVYIPSDVKSKHLKRMNGRLMPIRNAIRLMAQSEKMRGQESKRTARERNLNEWTDIYYGLPEA